MAIDKNGLRSDTSAYGELADKLESMGKSIHSRLSQLAGEEIVSRVNSILPDGYHIYEREVRPNFDKSDEFEKRFHLDLKVGCGSEKLTFGDSRLSYLRVKLTGQLDEISKDYGLGWILLDGLPDLYIG